MISCGKYEEQRSSHSHRNQNAQSSKLTQSIMSCKTGDDVSFETCFKHPLFQIRVCFLLMTNEAQGQSFREKLGKDLHEDWSSHCKLNMMLSRAIHPSIIVALSQRGDQKAKNILHHIVLSTKCQLYVAPYNCTSQCYIIMVYVGLL